MKCREARFHRPAKILQVFRMVHEYGKDEKSFALRKDKLQWRPINSASGYVADGILYLPEAVEADPKFGNCQLITIEDQADITPRQEWKLINNRYAQGHNHCFNLHHPGRYEIFSLEKDPPELWLRYQYSYVGDPTRDDFKLTTLQAGEPVEVKINGKIDDSSGRHFVEQYFIFLLLGSFDRCMLFPAASASVIKTVPADRKTISLIKPLW